MAPDTTSKNTAREKNAVVPGTLYLVATPIGNMADLSERAIKILSEVDFVAAEDTRNSGLLLSRLGIERPLVSYFEHNKRERGPYIVSRLQNGESCALVTDAGTPAISDPGEDLVALCADAGVTVTSVPGCCAAITALTLSGLPTRRFCFEGFFTGTKSERQKRLSALAAEDRTMIFYESPHHLRQTLSTLLDKFGDRKIALCREMTKLNEEVCRTTLAGAVSLYETKEPRGEYVLIVAGAPEKSTADADILTQSIPEHVASLMEEGHSRMDAIKLCAKARHLPKNDVYQAVLAVQEDTDSAE